jgi:HEPN domain-containing protein
MPMHRAEWQKLAAERAKDAKALLAIKRWAAAYYLAGYAVECALKSCVIAYLMRTDDFPDRRFSERCWTHSLTQLVEVSGLEAALDTDLAADPDLLAHWAVVRDWTEASRYAATPKADAVAMVEAVTDAKHGVFRWLKSCW